MQVTFPSLLTILFIGLKLTGYIDWSWLWVLSPIWGTFLIAFIVFFVFYLIAAYQQADLKVKRKKK